MTGEKDSSGIAREAFQAIIARSTPHANATVKAMAFIASEALAAMAAPAPPSGWEQQARAALGTGDLRPWGWAPGRYTIRCHCTPKGASFIDSPMGDKRATRCQRCAEAARDIFAATIEKRGG